MIMLFFKYILLRFEQHYKCTFYTIKYTTFSQGYINNSLNKLYQQNTGETEETGFCRFIWSFDLKYNLMECKDIL